MKTTTIGMKFVVFSTKSLKALPGIIIEPIEKEKEKEEISYKWDPTLLAPRLSLLNAQ